MTTEKLIEDIPCGQSVTTRYYNEAGEIIRQDVMIIVTKLAQVKADNGAIG